MFAISMSADHSPLQLISIDGRTAALFSYSDDSGNSAALLYYRSGAVLAGVITSSSISEEDLLSMMRTLSTRIAFERILRVYDPYDYEYAARWPYRYAGADVKLSGSVLQVLKGSETYHIRVATSGSYDDVVYIVVPFSSMPEYRILEGDYVDITGLTGGEYSYESVSGSTITLPHVIAETISVPGI
ncbi:MAG: hypothetical protein J6K32_08280 [Clostridia bacterium]|nr:hypothetical protein [Clostridia bacterium]